VSGRVDPVAVFGSRLSGIDKPARYLGGESGSTPKPAAGFRVALCFPDLYEIGMSNNAMRILYAGLNAIEGVACERVFAAAADYEALLRGTGTPAYCLESGTPVADCDILAFTVGYELLATNMLAVLDLAGIPLDCSARGEEGPVVIAGGPAITNPAPFGRFLDAVWIGEAEDAFFGLVEELAAAKAAGGGRAGILSRLRNEPAAWMPGKKAIRAVFDGFADRAYGHAFPVPVVKPVQDHGVVEIMRGCPNACRFCHAGYFYRPQRIRDPRLVMADVEAQVRLAGHREITLSSLSSGDYPGIFELLSALNARWSRERVSFQLPSLKVESFPLELIDQVSGTRKSGLTFAVETPLEQWQMTINKKVGLPKVTGILREAERSGYRLAKFYFMVGLPLPDAGVDEVDAIVEFLRQVLEASSLRVNATVATFVPKPHTPFQWSAQLAPDEATRRIYAIKDAFRGDQRIKISYHSPYLSWLEGIVSRGDGRVGELLLAAWRNGARFDAWDDLFRKDAWESAFAGLSFDPAEACGARPLDAALPWDDVNLRVGKGFLKAELERSRESVMSAGCAPECGTPCGSCTDGLSIVDKSIHDAAIAAIVGASAALPPYEPPVAGTERPHRRRLVLRYEKTGGAAYYAHHNVWNLIAAAFEKAGIALDYSQGFNPQPRLEISEPLSLGASSLDDYAVVLLREGEDMAAPRMAEEIGRFLPRGIRPVWVKEARGFEGRKFPSLSSAHWGSLFELDFSRAPDLGLEESVYGLTLAARESELLRGTSVELVSAAAMRVLLPFSGKREYGLSAMFEKACGIALRDSAVAVCRVEQYAKTADGGRTAYERFYGLSD